MLRDRAKTEFVALSGLWTLSAKEGKGRRGPLSMSQILHYTYFLYKKLFYRKKETGATEAKILRNYRATSHQP